MGASRIEEALAQVRRRAQVAVIPYLTVGFPTPEATLELVPALAEAGASVIELGIPFSDPLADGVTIQQATFHALQQGVTPQGCLQTCATLRERGLQVPLVLMGYYNPIYRYGVERFVQDAAAAGVDGLIAADLPWEEAAPLRAACDQTGLALIPLLAPTSTEERIAAGCQGARGFVYCISLTGVTGIREDLSPEVIELVGKVRHHTELAIAVGFGVSRRAHVQALCTVADAVVIGSGLIRAIEGMPQHELAAAARAFMGQFTSVPKPN